MNNKIEQSLDSLNSEQASAARHIDGPLLILAGAGSGKTKTITTRLAYLISLGIDPANTLTLTFTNKAADEMRSRALAMLEGSVYPPLLCTFHKFGLLFLKFHMARLGRKPSFVVIDSDDKKKVIKEFSPSFPSSSISNFISSCKNSIISTDEAKNSANGEFEKEASSIYEKYEEYLVKNSLVDFDDLLLLPYKILMQNNDVAEETSKKYAYITVDEYQDTNHLQFELLKLLCKTHSNICVVGDDDQSIYGFRGADVNNILSFADTFAGAKVVKLESNYRSTSQILDIANVVVSNNSQRLDKKLKSVKGDGKDIKCSRFDDERAESGFVAMEIKKLLQSGVNPAQIAVLFRMNALSRAIEEEFTKQKIAFRFVGGTMFYERAEIKDLLAYLRLCVNDSDDFSLKRVINRPKRGIGKTTLEKLETFAAGQKIQIFDAISNIMFEQQIISLCGKKTAGLLGEFAKVINNLNEKRVSGMVNFWNEFEQIVGLKSFFHTLGEEDRVDNIDEFLGMAKEFFKTNPEYELEDFLNDIALVSESEEQNYGDVSIMTVHSAKGLEFEAVFVVGLDDGFFPINTGVVDIEEERRLFYVAATRAKSHLYLLGAKSRFLHGERKFMPPSRFLKEAGLTDEPIAVGGKGAKYAKNDLVKHKIFGFGRVVEVVRDGEKLKINFGGQVRELLADFVEKAV